MAKRKPELRREDCITHEQKLAYSRQMYERWLAIGENEPPSVLLDFKRFPPETEDYITRVFHRMGERRAPEAERHF